MEVYSRISIIDIRHITLLLQSRHVVIFSLILEGRIAIRPYKGVV